MISNFGQSTLSNYKKENEIGKGAYGFVYKALDQKTNEYVAIKKPKPEIKSEGLPSTSIREISLLREINHKNIIILKDVVIDQKQLYLIFEYLDKDLKFYLQKSLGNQNMQPHRIKKFLYQMLSGIAECHMKRIIHRDLKPANILIDKNAENIKIGDFGLARTFSLPVRPYTQEVVTLWYRAPEILLGSAEYSTPIDVWSIGCIFAEMITKKPLFIGDSDLDQLYRIFRVLGTPNEQSWPGVTKLKEYRTTFPNWNENHLEKVVNTKNILDSYGLDLLNVQQGQQQKMLAYDPRKRITAKAALKHPYFKDINA